MAGSYSQHVEEFGFCSCRGTGVEMMKLEVEVSPGRFQYKNIPACDQCFGLKQ